MLTTKLYEINTTSMQTLLSILTDEFSSVLVSYPITDEYLIEHGWHKVTNLSDPEQKWYYFDRGILGRMHVDRCSKKPIYRLLINYGSDSRRVNTVTDIKVAIYSYVCGLQATKYGFDAEAGGYKWIDVDTKKEEDEYRYKKYREMVKAIE